MVLSPGTNTGAKVTNNQSSGQIESTEPFIISPATTPDALGEASMVKAIKSPLIPSNESLQSTAILQVTIL